jgi:hypothetical protein
MLRVTILLLLFCLVAARPRFWYVGAAMQKLYFVNNTCNTQFTPAAVFLPDEATATVYASELRAAGWSHVWKEGPMELPRSGDPPLQVLQPPKWSSKDNKFLV